MPDVLPDHKFDADDLKDITPAVTTIIEESRKGYKTTEFWLTVASSLLVAFDGIPLPDKYEGFVIGGLVGIYALARGVAKKGTPAQVTTAGPVAASIDQPVVPEA